MDRISRQKINKKTEDSDDTTTQSGSRDSDRTLHPAQAEVSSAPGTSSRADDVRS